MTISLAVALAAVLAGGGVWAQDYTPLDPPTRAPDLAGIQHETGLVMAVDAASGRLAVKSEGGRTKRFFAKRAKIISAEGKTIALADLSIGDRVSLTYKARRVTEVFRLHKALRK